MSHSELTAGAGMKWLRVAAVIVFALLGLAPLAAAQTPFETVRRALETGQSAQAISTLKSSAVRDPDTRLALGFAQFARSVERLMQGLHRYGLKTPQNPFLPIVRLPVPQNTSPEPVTYGELRALYQAFLDDLAAARTTLLATDGASGKLVLDLNAVRFAMPEGAGATAPTLGEVLATLSRRGRPARGTSGEPSFVEPWQIAFDRADALWLAGYTHMLSAMMEFVMAHDWQRTYDATAHLFFAGAPMPKEFAPPDQMDLGNMMNAMGSGIVDQIAMLHLIQWPAGDKTRMKAAHGHLKSAVATSRLTWKAILAETDDDREWLPSPKQQSRAVPSLPITEDAVAGWLSVLDDLDQLLDGQKLLAHWRFRKGIDMHAFFHDPKPFDLVLWITGHGAMPFLKDGPTLDGGVWRQWNRTFRNNFLGYAIFIN